MDLIQEYLSSSSLASSFAETETQDRGIIEDALDERNGTLEPDSSQTSEAGESSQEEIPMEGEQDMESSQLSTKHRRKCRKQRRNAGKSYTAKTGKTVRERSCLVLTGCRNDCNLKITREDQLLVFNDYWAQGSYPKRVAYIQKLITVKPKQRCRKRKESLRIRQCTAEYFLRSQGTNVKVCRQCFRNTIGETESFLQNHLAKRLVNVGVIPNSEKRGKKPPPNKTTAQQTAEIQSHIRKFPAYESHYSRSHTSKKYLQVGLTIRRMYNLYKTEVKNPKSLWVYRQVFSATGLKFKQPALDTCHKCDTYTAQLKYESDENKKQQILEQRTAHQNAADSAYKCKSSDKTTAKASNGTNLTCTFDLQQCLPTPLLYTSVSFYKRPLWTFNLTVNNNTLAKTDCFMWHESIATRRANEIASCLNTYLKKVDPEVSKITFYSDSCGGQNKNKIVSAMFSTVVANHPHIHTIDHKFLEPGHTHMERAKNQSSPQIHMPADWYDFVATCKASNPMEVTVMTQDSFYDFQKLYKTDLVARQKNVQDERFLWQEVKWLRYQKEQGIILYKKSLSENETFSVLDLRRNANSNVNVSEVTLLYNEPVEISVEKKRDLLSVLSLIRPEARDFYNQLPVSVGGEERNIDPDLDLINDGGEQTSQSSNSKRKDSTKRKSKSKVPETDAAPHNVQNVRRSNRLSHLKSVNLNYSYS